MEKIKENELEEIVKNNFDAKTILLELNGIIEGNIVFVKAD